VVQNGSDPITFVSKQSLIETFDNYPLNSYLSALAQQMVWKISFIRPLIWGRSFVSVELFWIIFWMVSAIPSFVASVVEDSGFW